MSNPSPIRPIHFIRPIRRHLLVFLTYPITAVLRPPPWFSTTPRSAARPERLVPCLDPGWIGSSSALRTPPLATSTTTTKAARTGLVPLPPFILLLPSSLCPSRSILLSLSPRYVRAGAARRKPLSPSSCRTRLDPPCQAPPRSISAVLCPFPLLLVASSSAPAMGCQRCTSPWSPSCRATRIRRLLFDGFARARRPCASSSSRRSPKSTSAPRQVPAHTAAQRPLLHPALNDRSCCVDCLHRAAQHLLLAPVDPSHANASPRPSSTSCVRIREPLPRSLLAPLPRSSERGERSR